MTVIDEAIILAGGLGTRLRGVVDDVPKPLAPVAGRPFLAWLLDALANHGVRRVVLATGYLGGQIEEILGTVWCGMELAYSREREPLGTGGALMLASRAIAGDAFLVTNGDTWLALDYAAFARTADAVGARLGVALASVPNVARYGAAELRGDIVTGFKEKGSSCAGFVNAGVYWVHRSLLEEYSRAKAFSFESDLLMPAVAREPVIGYTHTRGFIDIGVPEDFRRAQAMFGTERARAK